MVYEAGEGSRTPIFGLGSQRLSHWTTPAGVDSVPDADTLWGVRMRVFWPVTVAAAMLIGLLAYGVVSKGTDTSLDDAMTLQQPVTGIGVNTLATMLRTSREMVMRRAGESTFVKSVSSAAARVVCSF